MVWLQAQGLMTQDVVAMVDMAKAEVTKFYHDLIDSNFVIIDLPIKPLV